MLCRRLTVIFRFAIPDINVDAPYDCLAHLYIRLGCAGVLLLSILDDVGTPQISSVDFLSCLQRKEQMDHRMDHHPYHCACK